MTFLPRFFQSVGAVERNTWLFFTAQGLSMTTLNINIIIVGLAGFLIAPQPWLATLPLSIQFIASMMTTLPASLAMGRWGRKPIFVAGITLIAIGMAAQGLAFLNANWIGFLVASVLVGMAHGIAQFYRYAAADSVDEDKKPMVVSLVIAGGLIAAFAGAAIVNLTIGIFPEARYASCFFAAAILQILSLSVILSLKTPPLIREVHRGRPLSAFFKIPRFVAGLVAASLGYAVMSFMMTAAPLQIVTVSNLTDADNAAVIQWHVVAMFAPSFFTGVLIKRFGADSIIGAGLVFYLIAVVVLFGGTSFWHYLITLALVGFGWNALYVTGSAVIAASATPSERPKVQGVSDFIITTAIAISSLSAGWVHYLVGWKAVGFGALIPVGVISVFTLFALLYDKRARAV